MFVICNPKQTELNHLSGGKWVTSLAALQRISYFVGSSVLLFSSNWRRRLETLKLGILYLSQMKCHSSAAETFIGRMHKMGSEVGNIVMLVKLIPSILGMMCFYEIENFEVLFEDIASALPNDTANITIYSIETSRAVGKWNYIKSRLKPLKCMLKLSFPAKASPSSIIFHSEIEI